MIISRIHYICLKHAWGGYVYSKREYGKLCAATTICRTSRYACHANAAGSMNQVICTYRFNYKAR